MKNIFLAFFVTLTSLTSYSQSVLQATDKIASTSYIEFYSNYLVNLHHFIFNKAMHYSFYRNENQKQFDTLFAEIKTHVDETTKKEVMSAVKFYADSLSKKNMLFDEELTKFKISLQQSLTFDQLKINAKSPQIVTAMQNADALYQKHYWSEQDKKNRNFVLTKIETIKIIETDVIANCSKYYQYKYNGKIFRIDLTDYATFFSAYTTTEPYLSATISSTTKKHEGTQGIEVIFHEISHDMIDSVFMMQQKICTNRDLAFDHNVWHSILFYATGTFVKNALAKVGVEHELYLLKNKIADFNPEVKKTMNTITDYWQQHLDCKISMQNAMEHILVKNK
jgi:hypothetical protein